MKLDETTTGGSGAPVTAEVGEVAIVSEEEEEEEGERESEGWWEGEEAKTLEEEARDKGITNLFDPALLGMCVYFKHPYSTVHYSFMCVGL